MSQQDKYVDQTLKFIAQKEWTTKSDEFLRALSKFLGQLFEVDYVLINKYSIKEPNQTETVAVYSQKGFLPNMSYNLAYTPCENVIGSKLCSYPDNIQGKFPKDELLVQMNVNSYMGIPLWSSNGDPIGLIAIMDSKPIENPKSIETILQIAAIKAAQEMEKMLFDNILLAQINELKASEEEFKAANEQLQYTANALAKSNEELHQSKDKIEENEKKFRDFVEGTGDLITQVNAEGNFTYANQSSEKILGLKNEACIGQSAFDFIHPDDKEKTQSKFQGWIENQIRNMCFENRIINPSTGKTFNLLWTVNLHFDELGNLKYINSIANDITERKQIEDALKNSEEKFRAIFESSIDGIAVADVDTKIFSFVNSSFCTMLGYTPDELDSKGVMDIHPEEDLPFVIDQFDRLSKNEIAVAELIPVIRKDKSVFFADITTGNLAIKGKNYLVGIIRDITLRKESELKIQQSEHDLRELNATKDKFFSIIAHDLKSPCSSLIGLSDMLYKNFENYSRAESREFIDHIHQNVHKTHKLLDNLLLWSNVQSGVMKFYPERQNLFLIAQEAVELLKQMATDKKIDIKNNIPIDLYVQSDKNMSAIIIRNLISNALKFTNDNGAIIVNTRKTERQDKQNFTEISVQDNGVGIESNKRSKLFEITENTSTKGTANETGSGLGLILCKEFVEKHGGEIRIESEVGKGSKFTFTLPLVK